MKITKRNELFPNASGVYVAEKEDHRTFLCLAGWFHGFRNAHVDLLAGQAKFKTPTKELSQGLLLFGE